MTRVRHPLFWIVLAEVGLLLALAAVTWRVYQAHRPAAGATAATPAPVAPSPVGSPYVQVPVAVRPSPRALPGAPHRAGIPVDLAQLNRDQASLERAENRVLVEVIRAARSYLDRLVIPAVVRAERVSRATSPAVTQSPAAITKMP